MTTFPGRRAPDPGRTTPNGYCIVCGIALGRKDALRCLTHHVAHLNATAARRTWFTPEVARQRVREREAKRQAERDELAQLRAQVAGTRRRKRTEQDT